MRSIIRLFLLVGRALVVTPIRVVSRVLGGSFRLGLAVGTVPLRVSRRFARLTGLKGTAMFVVGLALGLLLAPVPGRKLRAKLKALARRASGPTDQDLAETVTFELGHAPRTWHLDQPAVAVRGGQVTLSGAVPDAGARTELVSVAWSIPGVVEVVDQLQIDGDGSSPES